MRELAACATALACSTAGCDSGGPRVQQIRSYDVVLTDVQGSLDGVAPPSKGWRGRLDLDLRWGWRSPKGVLSFGSIGNYPTPLPVQLDWVSTEANQLETTNGLTSTIRLPTRPWPYVIDTYAPITLDLDGSQTVTAMRADAMIGSSTVHGTYDATAPLQATFSIAPDTTAPTWSISVERAFPEVALPWDSLVLFSSEPYEGSADVHALFGDAASTLTTSRLADTLGIWSGSSMEWGIRANSSDWTGVPQLTIAPIPMADLMGNRLSTPPAPLPTGLAAVPPPKGSAPSAPFATTTLTWGNATSVDCGDTEAGKTCLELSPPPGATCTSSGVAFRVFASGTPHFRYRVLLDRNPAIPSDDIANVVDWAFASPGNPAQVSSPFGALTPGQTAPYDSGWRDQAIGAGATAGEYGFAIRVRSCWQTTTRFFLEAE